jgi:aldehyde dehydrogenase (NAD+)
MTPLQHQQSLDLAFDDAGSFDFNTEVLQFTNLDDSIIIDPYQQYNEFGLR